MRGFTNCLLALLQSPNISSKKCERTHHDELLSTYHGSLQQFFDEVFRIDYRQTKITELGMPTPCLLLDGYNLNLFVNCLTSNLLQAERSYNSALDCCNFAVLTAFDHFKKEPCSLPFSVIISFYKFAECLWQTLALPIPLMYVEVLTNLLSLLCLAEKEFSTVNAQSVVESKSRLPLSRKRPFESDVAKTTHEEKNRFVQLIVDTLKPHQVLLSEQQQVVEKVNCSEESAKGMLQKMRKSLSLLISIFEPFVNVLLVLKSNYKCMNLLMNAYNKSNVSGIYLKYAETYFLFCSRNHNCLQNLTFKTDLLHQIYGGLIKLSKLLVLWQHVTCDELNMPLNAENKTVLLCAMVFFSARWLQDLPWKDFRFGAVPFMTKSSIFSFCNCLQLSIEETKNNFVFSFLEDTLDGLALLPGSLSPSWRLSIIVEWALSCDLADVAISSLHACPLFCCKIKSVSISHVISELLTFFRNKLTVFENTKLKIQILKIFSPMVLVMSGHFLVCTGLYIIETASSCSYEVKTEFTEASSNDFTTLSDEQLTLIFEMEKIIYSYLSSTESEAPPIDPNRMKFDLITGICHSLKYVNKKKNSSLSLVLQLLKYFNCKINFQFLDPHFLVFDDEKWNGNFLKAVEETLRLV